MEPQPAGPIVYRDRIRGQRHRDRIARALADAPSSIRQPDSRPVRLPPAPSVFSDEAPAPRYDGPSDWLPHMKFRPKND